MAEQIIYRSVPMDRHRQFFSVQLFDDGTVRIGLERQDDDGGSIYFSIDMDVDAARTCALALDVALPEETTHAG